MELGTLPYRAKKIASGVDGNGAPTITVQVQDGTGANKGSAVVVPLGGLGDPQYYDQTIGAVVWAQAVADAGSITALLAAMVSSANQLKETVLGSPAFVPSVVPVNGLSPLTWTNMPAALTEAPGARCAFDMTLVTAARLSVYVLVAGSTNAVVGLQYSIDSGGTWHFLDGGTGPNVAINSTGQKQSGWVNLEAAAKADVLLRFGGQGGDGAADPQFGLSLLQVR